MDFSRQENWNGLPFPSSGDLPNPGIKPGSSALQTDSLLFEPPKKHCRWILYHLSHQGSPNKSSDTIKKLPELIIRFSKVTVYKISMQKPVAFPYANSEPAEKETEKTILFVTASNRTEFKE